MRLAGPRTSGTVSLVALCFVAVLGIALASYLTVCTRAMNLSNRSFQSGLSQQLAEFGLEEGLRAFNKNDWSDWTNGISVNWDTSTYASSKRAVATVTFPAGKFGPGVTATVKIRVDNYDANSLGSTYNSAATYRANDVVYYGGTSSGLVAGTWYRYVNNSASSGNAPATSLGYPNLTYWVPAPVPWMWNNTTAYSRYDVVCYNGTWYLCSNSSGSPAGNLPTSGDWTSMPTGPTLAITSSTNYTAGSYGFRQSEGIWYRCTSTHFNSSWDSSKWTAVTTSFGWAFNSGATYSYNDIVFHAPTAGNPGTFYRCRVATTTGAFSLTNWENALIGANTNASPGAHGWSSSGINYNIGDIVCYYSSSTYNFYRCIRAHSSTSILPTNTTYWAATPLYPQEWQPNHQYSQYDTVRYKGIQYLSLTSTNNSGRIPNDASSSYWAAAPQAIAPWNANSYYELDELVSRGGSWYRCIRPQKNQAPPNATYWTVLTGSGSSYVWSASTAYSSGQYRSYGGVWYKSTAATTANAGQSPNDTAYWTSTWTQASNTSISTGAPVVYAEATITSPNNPTVRTQLRATIAPAPLFPNAVGSSSTLTIGGAGTIDSYDGSVRLFLNGNTVAYLHDEQAVSPFTSSNHNIGYSAIIAAAGSGSGTKLSVTGTTIQGFGAATPASTAPFAPLASFGTNARLQNSDGTTTSPDATALNVDLTRVSRSPYVPNFATLPAGGLVSAFASANFPRGSSIPLSTPTNLILGIAGAPSPSRYYYDDDWTIASGATVTIVGPVILYIKGDLQINGVMNIASSGSAEIHIGDSLMIGSVGNGIDNKTRDPKKLTIICDTAGASTQYYQDGSTSFYGTIYAPNTTSTSGLQFNSGSTTTIFGAISAKKVEFANNATVHYDTSLRYASTPGVEQPFTVMTWQELTGAEKATMP